MSIRNLTLDQLTQAHQAADYLCTLPTRLDQELTTKLDTLRADLTAELEDRGHANLATRRTPAPTSTDTATP